MSQDDSQSSKLSLASAVTQLSLVYNPVTRQLEKKVEVAPPSLFLYDIENEELKCDIDSDSGIALDSPRSTLTSQRSSTSDETNEINSEIEVEHQTPNCSHRKSVRRKLSDLFSFPWKRSSQASSTFAIGKQKSSPNINESLNGVGEGRLILESRPANLPAKPIEEESKHIFQYSKMINCANRKVLKEAKKKHEDYLKQQKLDEDMAERAAYWLQVVLPRWDERKDEPKTIEMYKKGLPPSVRGKIWSKTIGNKLEIPDDTFEDCLMRFHSTSSTSDSVVEQIQLDIIRTFPRLAIFQVDGPYHEPLLGLLGSVAIFDSELGYVQGMAFVAAILLLQMEPKEAFVAMCNLLRHPFVRALYTLKRKNIRNTFLSFEQLLEFALPKLYSHFAELEISPELYLLDWLLSLYAKPLSLDVCCRIWDYFLKFGDHILFMTAICILRKYEGALMSMDFITAAKFLTSMQDQSFGLDDLLNDPCWNHMSFPQR